MATNKNRYIIRFDRKLLKEHYCTILSKHLHRLGSKCHFAILSITSMETLSCHSNQNHTEDLLCIKKTQSLKGLYDEDFYKVLDS